RTAPARKPDRAYNRALPPKAKTPRQHRAGALPYPGATGRGTPPGLPLLAEPPPPAPTPALPSPAPACAKHPPAIRDPHSSDRAVAANLRRVRPARAPATAMQAAPPE